MEELDILNAFATPHGLAVSYASDHQDMDDEELLAFCGRDWREVDAVTLSKYCDAFYKFSPDRYRHFAPSVFLCLLRGYDCGRCQDIILGDLLRSPNTDLWSPRFISIWENFSHRQLSVIKDLVIFLFNDHRLFAEEWELERAVETIDLLKLMKSLRDEHGFDGN